MLGILIIFKKSTCALLISVSESFRKVINFPERPSLSTMCMHKIFFSPPKWMQVTSGFEEGFDNVSHTTCTANATLFVQSLLISLCRGENV